MNNASSCVDAARFLCVFYWFVILLLSFIVFGWYCGAGVFGLMGCQSVCPGQAMPTFLNNNTNLNYPFRMLCYVRAVSAQGSVSRVQVMGYGSRTGSVVHRTCTCAHVRCVGEHCHWLPSQNLNSARSGRLQTSFDPDYHRRDWRRSHLASVELYLNCTNHSTLKINHC